MDEPPVTGRIVVLVADPSNLKRENLYEPAILIAKLPRASRFLSVISMPNILEVMGMGSGGGAPGFSVLIPAMSLREPKQPLINRFIAAFPPNTDIRLSQPLGLYVGTAKSAGIVLNYFEVVLDEATQNEPFEKLVEKFKEKGFTALQLLPYETPEAIIQRATPREPPGTG